MSNRRTRRKNGAAPSVAAPDEALFVLPTEEETETRGRRWAARLWTVAKLVIGTALTLGVAAGVAFGAHRYALTTPRFAIRDVSVEGARRLSSEQVQALAGVARGSNVFALDVVGAERRLLEDPWIAEARVTRRLPGHVRIDVSEREAGAVVAIGNQLMLATRSGEIFKPLAEGDPYDLPVVTGISPEALARDRARELERLGSALDLLRQYERIPLSQVFPAQELHVPEGGSAALTVGREGLTLQLGPGPWKQKLLRAARVVEKAQARGELPGIVFLDNEAHPERVVVRMR
jgi:cell division protein FtsQ